MNKLFDFYDDVRLESKYHLLNDDKLIYFFRDTTKISPWHDIDYLNSDGTINMICEIPRYTRKKYEIQRDIEYNPIVQDRIFDEPREYKYGDMLFNYGAIPQTWEDPNILCDSTMKYGDNDPLDIIDIGDTQAKVGYVYKVKILGVLALIDEDETDWKVIGINVKDENSDKITCLEEVEEFKPGCLKAVKRWFENYKTARGKKKNCFAFDGKYKDMDYTRRVIDKCHEMWKVKFHTDSDDNVLDVV